MAFFLCRIHLVEISCSHSSATKFRCIFDRLCKSFITFSIYELFHKIPKQTHKHFLIQNKICSTQWLSFWENFSSCIFPICSISLTRFPTIFTTIVSDKDRLYWNDHMLWISICMKLNASVYTVWNVLHKASSSIKLSRALPYCASIHNAHRKVIVSI